MSLKFDRPAYKVYEPGYHPHRTIILDEQIESQETLTIRLAEEAARGGGDLSGDSPTGLLPMSAYKSQPPQLHGYTDPPYSQQSSQGFTTQQSETTASQINQLAFAANSTAAGQVSLKVESEYGLAGSTSSSAPFAYGFPPSVSVAAAATQAQAQAQSDYISNTAGAYNQKPASILGIYRSGPLPDYYPRVPPILRSPHGGTTWTPFGNYIDSIRSPTTAATHSTYVALIQPGYTALQHSPAPAPALIRTRTLTQQFGNSLGGGGNYNPYRLYQTKATLEIHGNLQAMAENWTQEEWDNKRRLVMFKKKQNGSVLTITFKPVSVSERPPNSICISCIWWQEREECFVTSVDTIHLLEQLLAAPSKFSVEEKNRIRRNLEGFHPLTVSKAELESREFFKVIMGFGNPKPQNIAKKVKVFKWETLGQSLSKIISKYSAATLATASATGPLYFEHVSAGSHAGCLSTMDDASDSSHSSPDAASVQTQARKAPRAERRCDICRKHKSRCVKEPDQERCLLCTSRDRVCIYNDIPQPRRKRAGLPDDGVASVVPGIVEGLGSGSDMAYHDRYPEKAGPSKRLEDWLRAEEEDRVAEPHEEENVAVGGNAVTKRRNAKHRE